MRIRPLLAQNERWMSHGRPLQVVHTDEGVSVESLSLCLSSSVLFVGVPLSVPTPNRSLGRFDVLLFPFFTHADVIL